MTIEEITDPKDVTHHHSVRLPTRPDQPETSAVRGGASLDD